MTGSKIVSKAVSVTVSICIPVSVSLHVGCGYNCLRLDNCYLGELRCISFAYGGDESYISFVVPQTDELIGCDNGNASGRRFLGRRARHRRLYKEQFTRRQLQIAIHSSNNYAIK